MNSDQQELQLIWTALQNSVLRYQNINELDEDKQRNEADHIHRLNALYNEKHRKMVACTVQEIEITRSFSFKEFLKAIYRKVCNFF